MLHVLKAPEIMNGFFAHDRVSFNERCFTVMWY